MKMIYAAAVVGLLSAGCARCAPGRVAQGVSRLTIRNFGAMVDLVNTDTACGFESPEVLSGFETTGRPGQIGKVTWTVTDCLIDIPEDQPLVKTDCNGTDFTISGRVQVSARKTITGPITGDPEIPVVPAGKGSVTIEVTMGAFDNFVTRSSLSDSSMRWVSGRISGKLSPQLAVDRETGACSIPTKHVLFSDIEYQPTLVEVSSGSRQFHVEVDGSDLGAVHGVVGDRENALWGTVSVWGGQQEVPSGSDDDGLDPEYDLELLEGSYACKPNLALPVRYTCEDVLSSKLAQSAARLSVRTWARLASAIEADTECGFSSPAVMENAQLQGAVGSEGAAVLTVDRCTLSFAPNTLITKTCTGIETLATGRVTVSGTKTLTGRLTGDTQTPVLPTSDAPAVVDLKFEDFDRLEIASEGTAMEVLGGVLEGKISPRVARDAERSGACSFKTDNARFTDLRWTRPADVILKSEGTAFDTKIEASDLTAVAGTWGSDTNMLRGTINLRGENYTLPTDPADDGLQPDYDQAKFDAEWMCGSLEQPVNYNCKVEDPLAQGAARLSVQFFGALAKLMDADTTCGFSSAAVAGAPQITGELGRRGGRALFTVDQPCEITFPQKTEISRDCNGKATYAIGTVRMRGTKSVAGIVTGDPETPIIPTRTDPALITLNATFENFGVWSDPETQKLTAVTGQLRGSIAPRVAIDTETGACSISTPVARFEDLNWSNATLTLENDGLTFDLDVSSSQLDAQSGAVDNTVNLLQGKLTMGGESFDIPVSGQPTLDPDYDAARFDASYACTENLRRPESESDCDMREVIAYGVARMVSMTAGTLASQINGNSSCGFETFLVKIQPARVVGDTGDSGEIAWAVEGCEISHGPASDPVDTDCFGKRRYLNGSANVDAARTVRGIRKSAYYIFDSITPVAHDSVTIELRNARLTNLKLLELRDGASDPFRGIEYASGELSATVQPIVGENASEQGTYDVATPVAHMTKVTLRDAPVTLRSGAMTFKARVDTSDFEAFNGSWNQLAMTNVLRGTVTVDGVQITLDGPLDPAYEQSTFDGSYACTAELMSTVPPAP